MILGTGAAPENRYDRTNTSRNDTSSYGAEAHEVPSRPLGLPLPTPTILERGWRGQAAPRVDLLANRQYITKTPLAAGPCRESKGQARS